MPRKWHTEYTLEKCKIIAEKASSASDLPYQCKKFPEAVKAAGQPPIKRTVTCGANAEVTLTERKDTQSGGAYDGMQGGLAAQAAKKSGRESHAQIQRRLTNSRRFTKQK